RGSGGDRSRRSAGNERTMNKPFLFLILMSLGGCQSDNGEGVANGTETNWLTACDSSKECGVGSCVCGLCTFECSEASDCDRAPEAARCATGTDDAFQRECAGA